MILLHTDLHGLEDATAMERWLNIFSQALIITYFVMIMMMVIEYFTIVTRGKWDIKLQKKPFFQMVIASLLGIIPGCLGTFTVVTLYLHQIFRFSSMNVAMIATTGDEAFLMYSMFPGKALLLNVILFLISIISGLVIALIFRKNDYFTKFRDHLVIHENEPVHVNFHKHDAGSQPQKLSFVRALLITGLALFLIFVIFFQGDEWGWERITLVISTIIGLVIVIFVSKHFLTDHLWQHTVKKHIPRIFLWTIGTFAFLEIVLHNLHIEHYLENNYWIVLAIALIIGIIPQSGPNLVFVTLFASGHIPFSILLANSIVQNGHGSMPLLAESRKSFVIMKSIGLFIGLLAGIVGVLFGF